MKDDVTSPAPAPAKTAKPRAKAKAPAAPEVKTVKPKAPPKPKAVDAAPVPGDAEKAEARKLELENAKVQGVMEHMQREAKQAELAAKTQALWEKAHPDPEKEFEPMSDAQKFEFFRLQRQQDQEKADAAKAAEAARLATVSPRTAEQTFAAARAEQSIKPEEVENSIEAGPVREVTPEQAREDGRLVNSIAGTAGIMMSAPRGEVSLAEAKEMVAADVADLEKIKTEELRNKALQIMDESRVAQVQYRIALDHQAPAVAKEIDAKREADIQQGINPDAKAARWGNAGKQTPARTPEQVAADLKASSQAEADRATEDRAKAIPDAVKAKYLKVENDYFFQDKKPAFIDRGTKLATKGENPEVIASLVSIAKARGWGNVTVKGTEDFRRAAWHEASLNGLEVAGYTPTKVELAQLDFAKTAIEKAKPDNTLEKGRAAELAKAPEAPVQAASAKAPATMRDTVKEAPAAPSVAAKAPAIAFPAGTVGKLVGHGRAPYKNDPKNDQSYFVTVQTARGEETLWGVDLNRAVEKSGAKIGETISLDSKTVEGRKAKEWTVGSLDKASSFASGTRDASVKEYPDLAGVHGTAAAAQAFFKQHMPGHEDRVAAIGKSIMAGNIAAGKDVPAVQLREVQKVKSVDQERTPKTDDRERA